MRRQATNLSYGMAAGLASIGRAIVFSVLIVIGIGVATGMMLYRTLFVPACSYGNPPQAAPIKAGSPQLLTPIKLYRSEVPYEANMPSDAGTMPPIIRLLPTDNQEPTCHCPRSQ